ncbi:uncharacterized protein BKA78DRAFT_310163, partial [Phyllosticta capitalensis]|uniref:uncharacterized protein n=1 Tax=Phyllosticta capitalensis TaxID=121624 RepID=UPI003131788E
MMVELMTKIWKRQPGRLRGTTGPTLKSTRIANPRTSRLRRRERAPTQISAKSKLRSCKATGSRRSWRTANGRAITSAKTKMRVNTSVVAKESTNRLNRPRSTATVTIATMNPLLRRRRAFRGMDLATTRRRRHSL